jgi:hypothetical protein
MNWKKTSLFLFSFYRKIELQCKKTPLHKQQTNTWISGKYCIIFFILSLIDLQFSVTSFSLKCILFVINMCPHQKQKSIQREPYGLKQWEKPSMHNCRELAIKWPWRTLYRKKWCNIFLKFMCLFVVYEVGLVTENCKSNRDKIK